MLRGGPAARASLVSHGASLSLGDGRPTAAGYSGATARPIARCCPEWGNSGGVGSNSGVTLPNQPDQCQTHWSGGRESAAPVLADLAVDHLDGGADDGQEHGDADQDRGWWQRERELLAKPGDGQHAGE